MYMIAEVSQYVAVASFPEAWIEITTISSLLLSTTVASFPEAWIEISITLNSKDIVMSPPSRRRGLKSLEKSVLIQYCGRLLPGGVD